MADDSITAEPRQPVVRPPARTPAPVAEILDMVWPETGLQTSARVSERPRDTLGEDDVVELEIDFVRLSLSPLEFIQLASFLRMTVDGLLEQHPGLQRAVVNAFDIRD
ncbi:MAG: hypothetical protein KC442_18015 [Thermomicrobiales bacterium]|nr:hypothetical protein [Thermomicrobiales bacterium]